MAPSPEFSLVAACAAWPPSPARSARIADLAVSFDPAMLVRVAMRHTVCGLVAQGLGDAGVPLPNALARIARRRGAAALAQTRAALDLDARFAAAGIPLLFLKGASLAQHAFGQIAIRQACDIDLVIAPADVAASWRVMRAAGYDTLNPARDLSGTTLRTFLRAAKDSLHRHPSDGTIVELHWRLSDELADARLPSAASWQRIAVAPGRSLATLGDDDLFVYLSAHGAQHLWARLKWLADIAALIAASTDGGAAYWRAAQARGAQIAVASAFLLAARVLGTPLPPGFIAPRSLRLRLLVHLAMRTMLAGGGARELATTPYRGWGEIAAKLLIAPRLRNGLGTLRRIAVSSEDVASVPLPGGLAFLYPLIRIPRLVARRRRRAMRISARRTPSASS